MDDAKPSTLVCAHEDCKAEIEMLDRKKSKGIFLAVFKVPHTCKPEYPSLNSTLTEDHPHMSVI